MFFQGVGRLGCAGIPVTGLTMKERIVPTSPTIILYHEAKELILQMRIEDAFEVLLELETHSPKRAAELLKLI